MGTGRTLSLAGVAVAVLALTGPASAGTDPQLNLSVLSGVGLWNNDGNPFDPTSVEGNIYTYSGNHTYGDGETDNLWQLTYDVIYDIDPVVDLNFSITNNTGHTETFIVTADLPLLQQLTGGTIIGGSVGGFVLDGIIGTGVDVTADPLFTGLVDQNPALTLGNSFSFSTPNGVDTLPTFATGLPGPGIPGPAIAMNEIGIQIAFTLTDGDTISIASSFEIQPLPTPGVFALLGVAGLVGRRRRRS